MYTTIDSAKNNSLRLAKSLHQNKKRRKTGLILLEGFRMVYDALESGALIKFVLIAEDVLGNDNTQNLINILHSKSIRLLVTNEHLFNDVSSTVNSQGVVAIVQKPEYSLCPKGDVNKVLVLNQIQDPGNLGTLIRSADAFGIDKVLVTKGSCDIYNLKALRSTMSSIFSVPVIDYIESEECFEYIKMLEIPVYITDPSGGLFLPQVKPPLKWAIVLGNEGNGVDDFWINNADYKVNIPMSGNAESLNVAMAGSITMYHFSCF